VCLFHRTPDRQSTRKTEGHQLKAVLLNGGFSASYDSLVVGSSAVLRLNFCAKNPPLRKAAKRYEFQKCVKRYNGYFRARQLNCWNQFVQLFFGQLTARNGLRDICLCLNAHKNNLYHLGIKQSVNQSTLSRANENRDWRIFADFGTYLINLPDLSTLVQQIQFVY
jgi:hypothetical protein